MKKLPEKNFKKWLLIFCIYWLILSVSFLLTRIILKTELLPNIIISFVILAFISSLIPNVVGFFGGRTFFMVNALFTCIAVLYMFMVILSHSSPGWEDLTSVVGYIFISLFGILVSTLAQFIVYIRNKRKSSAL